MFKHSLINRTKYFHFQTSHHLFSMRLKSKITAEFMHPTAAITKKKSTPATIFHDNSMTGKRALELQKKEERQEHEQAKSSIIHIIRAQQLVAYLDSEKMFS